MVLTLASYPDLVLATVFFIIDLVLMTGAITYVVLTREHRKGTESAFDEREPRDPATHRPD